MHETKILVTGDLHYRGTRPRSRLDHDIEETLTAKLEEVWGIARESQCSAIIIPGDLTDTPNLSYASMSNLADLLRRAPVPVMTIPGNHDLYGNNPATIGRTPYGLLARLGLILNLHESGFRGIEGAAKVSGTSYHPDMDNDPTTYQSEFGIALADPYRDAPHIHVAHGMLLDNAPGYSLKHTLIKDVARDNDADIIVVGHDHIGFGVRRVEGKIFINPGSILRVPAHNANMTRQVGVVMITLDNGTPTRKGDIHTEWIPLDTARPSNEVISRKVIEEENMRTERVAQFLGLLRDINAGPSNALSIDDIVRHIAAHTDVAPEVVDDALDRISVARANVDV